MIKNNKTLFCFRCYHCWTSREDKNPKYCPKCHSPYWSKPRKNISKNSVLKLRETIINIHNKIIEISGGEKGIREDGGIYNSTYKLLNYQEKNKNNPVDIGAFILNEFARRHYFVDGNKRTAYALAKIFMMINRCHLKINYSNATDFIISVAEYESKIELEEIKDWLKKNSIFVEEKNIESYLNKEFINVMLGDENEEDE
jgi:death on curing protein